MSQQCPYMQEPWFLLLVERCSGVVRARIAEQLGISSTALSMVLNGTGPYGNGTASTAHIAERVVHTFGRYACPHLTAESGGDQEHVITADQCRVYAHRPPPIGSPLAMQHWQACRQCPHLEASAPPVERTPVPRKTVRAPSTPSPQEAPRDHI
ncbi:hypothetical protein KIH07_02865 [Hydrogenophaga taeniospiralis]|uniref:hypothetical protein n=1 Tax=Hydrogenophaga taeniospiralis TaxID=65656 RepID=UPI001CFA9B7F|nr:hypothetical protein [Hydrogenophaga taeniospiralis]MCB4362660.1 hypothetical protein [Hydrogenophaga taeniospiralis]